MSCLNCNKETSGRAVFCESCLQQMEAFPVEKGTPVVIPVQPSPAQARKQSYELLGSLEENLSISRRSARRLAGALIIMTVLLLLLIATLLHIITFGVPDFLRNIRIPV